MGIESDILADWDAAVAALAWQFDCGADEAMSETPVNRYEAAPAPKLPQFHSPAPVPNSPAPARGNRAAPPEPSAPQPKIDPVALAKIAADAAPTLEALRQSLMDFDHCELKRGARNTVFADGNAAARVMVIGDAPGREEDLEGRPYTGKAGGLFDKMFQAIGLDRNHPDPAHGLYLAKVICWRPEGDRDPSLEEVAMMRPFLERHIALADPDVIVAMGHTPLLALTGQRSVTRARGHWQQAFGKPVMPMLPPEHLLRNPDLKREAWADLLALKMRLEGQS